MSYKFTIIITQEGKWYVSKCVELGVASQGKTIEEAQKNLTEAIELYLDDQPKSKLHFSKKAPFVTTLEIRHG
jgi:predicted RNase H-like HicB family nuclease